MSQKRVDHFTFAGRRFVADVGLIVVAVPVGQNPLDKKRKQAFGGVWASNASRLPRASSSTLVERDDASIF